MFPRESMADEDEESVAGQTVYADFKFSVFFDWKTIDVGLRQKYGSFKGKSPSDIVQNSALQSPWASRHPSASMQVTYSLKVSSLLSCAELQYKVQD